MAAAKRLWPAGEKPTSYLVHGDYCAGNTLWKNEKLVAIVDWEEPRIGEPTFDITDLVQDAAFSGIDIEQSAIDQYERVSGRSPRDHKFWSMVGVTITSEEVNFVSDQFRQPTTRRFLAGAFSGELVIRRSLGRLRSPDGWSSEKSNPTRHSPVRLDDELHALALSRIDDRNGHIFQCVAARYHAI